MPGIGPYSKPEALRKLDGRSCHARLVKKIRADLTTHVGGKPSATQNVLIERAAWITLHMTLMDAHMLRGDASSERDARQYLAWSNTLTRLMRTLSLERLPVPVESLDDLRRRHASAAA